MLESEVRVHHDTELPLCRWDEPVSKEILGRGSLCFLSWARLQQASVGETLERIPSSVFCNRDFGTEQAVAPELCGNPQNRRRSSNGITVQD